MPRTTVTVTEEGREINYEGVLVGEMLKRAGAPVGRDLSGKAVATYVRANAKDGYQVVFSLAGARPGLHVQRHHRRRHHRRQAAVRLPGAVPDRRAARQARRALDPHAAAHRRRPAREVGMSRAALRLRRCRLVGGRWRRRRASRRLASRVRLWHLPADFPRPRVPADNPMSDAEGRAGATSVLRHAAVRQRHAVVRARCHEQARAFTDGKGARGRIDRRGASARQR